MATLQIKKNILEYPLEFTIWMLKTSISIIHDMHCLPRKQSWSNFGANINFYVKLQILGKNPSSSFIIREWPKQNLPTILRNIDNFPPGAFYSAPHYN